MIGCGLNVCPIHIWRSHISIVIHPPHRQRIKAQMLGDVIHDLFNADDTLRAAKAAKGGGRLHIGLEPVRGDADVFKMIGIVRVQHRPVGDRQ